MQNSEIQLNKRSYRGMNNFTVSWKANGFPDQKDFDTENLALAFINELKAEVGVSDWTSTTEKLLTQLEATPEDLNTFLQDLTTKTKNGFIKWQEYVQQSIELRIKLSTLAINESVSAENYIKKLSAFGDTPLDEVISIYQEHTKNQKATKDILEAYLERIQLEEADEDEVDFIKRKLTRFLEAFNFNILAVEDADVIAYVQVQKGSNNAKIRLNEIIVEFKSFADKADSKTSA